MPTPYRIAIRTEEDLVNLWLAKIDTMEEALLVASVAKVCLEDPEVEKALHLFANTLAVSLVQRITDCKVTDVQFLKPR